MKKLFYLLTCIILATGLLTACGGDKAQPEKPAAEEKKAQETPKGEETLKSLFANSKEIKAMSFTMVVTADGKTLTSGKMWVKGNKFKMENSAEGMDTAIFYADGDKKIAYSYIPSQQMATKMDYGQAETQTQYSPLDYSEEYGNDEKMDFKVVGTEVVNGYKCEVIEMVDKEGTAKLWVSKELGLPIKIESKTGGSHTVMEYKDIQVGNIPDSEFELPAGVQVVDMNEMMKNLPNMVPPQQ